MRDIYLLNENVSSQLVASLRRVNISWSPVLTDADELDKKYSEQILAFESMRVKVTNSLTEYEEKSIHTK